MTFSHPALKALDRASLIQLLQTALGVSSLKFAQQTALQWLAVYPGDLSVQQLYAQTLLMDGQAQHALLISSQICRQNPESAPAQAARAMAADQTNDPQAKRWWQMVIALEGDTDPAHPASVWSASIWAARKALQSGNLDLARQKFQEVSAFTPPPAIQAALDVRILLASQASLTHPDDALRQAAAQYHQQFPECLLFKILHAHCLMDSGQENQAVNLLHQAASQDIGAQVMRSLWGEDHPYQQLWPNFDPANPQEGMQFDIPVPAEVAAVMGWNQLAGKNSTTQANKQAGTGQKRSPKFPPRAKPISQTDKDFREIQRELAQVAAHIKKPILAREDGRFPVYVILSSRQGLQQQYGAQSTQILIKAMRNLASVVGSRLDWDAMLLLADDPASTASLGLQPAPYDRPWDIKLLLADLDQALAKQGSAIGALLIVGNDGVIPMHRLPNPTDDLDANVPSDNPYGTSDENFFLPEWPVGRLPGSGDDDPAPIFRALQQAEIFHRQQGQVPPWYRRIWQSLLQRTKTRWSNSTDNFGYTAAVWRRSALHVFRSIGDPGDLWISPPKIADEQTGITLPVADLAYFNLHGTAEDTEWFGQRDSYSSNGEEDYPVAMRPEDILNGNAPKMVFSEACYGANILNKTDQTAIALKLMAAGTRAMVGSTVTAYGAFAPPLSAADCLGQTFWKNAKAGQPVGLALQKAKLSLAYSKHQKEGYLDGADQKTLLSFVLYGDPLYQYGQTIHSKQAVIHRALHTPQVKTVCDRADVSTGTISPEILMKTKSLVEKYLPGMQGAEISIAEEHLDCSGKGHSCPNAQLGAKSHPLHAPHRKVIVLSKTIPGQSHAHHRYARITLDESGKLVKMAVSH